MQNVPSASMFHDAWDASRAHQASQEFADDHAAEQAALQQQAYDSAVSRMAAIFGQAYDALADLADMPTVMISSGTLGALEAQFISEVTAKGFEVTEHVEEGYFVVSCPP